MLLAFAAAGLSARKASPAPRPGPGPGPGPQPVPLVNTGGRAWARTRLEELELADVGGDVALSVLAQWDLETAHGRGEWNFNVGNIRPVGNEPRVELAGAGAFRAYASLEEGVRAYLALMQSQRYASCWAMLNADPLSDEWARCLARKGYCGQCDPDAYARAWRARRAALANAVQGGELLGFLNALRPAR